MLAELPADSGLALQRLSPSAWVAAGAPQRTPLGELGYGVSMPGVAAAPSRVAARLLSPAGPMVDAWISGAGPQQSGACGSVRFDLAALHLTAYLRRARQLPLIRAELGAAVGAESFAARTAVYLEADICRSDLWVEIEAHAFATGAVTA